MNAIALPVYDAHPLQKLEYRLPGATPTITNLFRLHTPDVITVLYSAAHLADWSMVHVTLVRLRGSSLAIGGTYLAQLCGDAEQCLMRGETDTFPEYIVQIDVAFNILLSMLPR